MARFAVGAVAMMVICVALSAAGGRPERGWAQQWAYDATWSPWNIMPTSMTVGQDVVAVVYVTNSGLLAWNDTEPNPVNLSYHWRAGACPGTSTAVWDGLRSALNPGGVPPSGSALLSLTVSPPASAGTYCLAYDMVREGVTWFSAAGSATQSSTVSVAPRLYDVSWGATDVPASMAAGSISTLPVSMSNSGAVSWTAGSSNPFALSYHWLNGACPGTGVAVWDGLRTQLGADVPSGAALNAVGARVRAPAVAGTYCLAFDMVRENVRWFSRYGSATHNATVSVTSSPYGASWDSQFSPGGLVAGVTAYTWVTVTNTGSFTWSAAGPNPVRVSYHVYAGGCPPGSLVQFDNARASLPDDVAPGGSATLVVPITAPLTPGWYCIALDLVQEGITWFSTRGVATRTGLMRAYMPGYDAVWAAATPDGGPMIPDVMSAGSVTTATVSLWNVGTMTWTSGGSNPVRFSYHWYDGNCVTGALAVWDGVRSGLPADVPGSGGVLNDFLVTITAPPNPGTYCLMLDLVHEGITWFGWQGSGVIVRAVAVN